jgi:hypothetical protein
MGGSPMSSFGENKPRQMMRFNNTEDMGGPPMPRGFCRDDSMHCPPRGVRTL